MGIKDASDLWVVIKIDENVELDSVDHLEVSVFDRQEHMGDEEQEREPIALLQITRVLGNHELIVDSADAISSAFYFGARALLGQKDADINSYLARILRLPAKSMSLVNTLFYLDRVMLKREVPPDQVKMILSAAMQKVAKGMEVDRWLGIAYAKKTIYLENWEEKTRVLYGMNKAGNIFKEVGFEAIPNPYHDENPLLAVSGARLKLEFKKENKLENDMSVKKKLRY